MAGYLAKPSEIWTAARMVFAVVVRSADLKVETMAVLMDHKREGLSVGLKVASKAISVVVEKVCVTVA